MTKPRVCQTSAQLEGRRRTSDEQRSTGPEPFHIRNHIIPGTISIMKSYYDETPRVSNFSTTWGGAGALQTSSDCSADASACFSSASSPPAKKWSAIQWSCLGAAQ